MDCADKIYPVLKKKRYDLEIAAANNVEDLQDTKQPEEHPLQICEEKNTEESNHGGSKAMTSVIQQNIQKLAQAKPPTESTSPFTTPHAICETPIHKSKSSSREKRALKRSHKYAKKLSDPESRSHRLSKRLKIPKEDILKQPLHKMILTPYELNLLFYKYKCDGHFKDNPNLPPFTGPTDESINNYPCSNEYPRTPHPSSEADGNSYGETGNFAANNVPNRGNPSCAYANETYTSAAQQDLNNNKENTLPAYPSTISRQNYEDAMSVLQGSLSSSDQSTMYSNNASYSLDKSRGSANYAETATKSYANYENSQYNALSSTPVNSCNYRQAPSTENVDWKYANKSYYNYSYNNSNNNAETWNNCNSGNSSSSNCNNGNNYNGAYQAPANSSNTFDETSINTTAEIVAQVLNKYQSLPLNCVQPVNEGMANVPSDMDKRINNLRSEQVISCENADVFSPISDWRSEHSPVNMSTASDTSNVLDKTTPQWNSVPDNSMYSPQLVSSSSIVTHADTTNLSVITTASDMGYDPSPLPGMYPATGRTSPSALTSSSTDVSAGDFYHCSWQGSLSSAGVQS